MKDFRRSLAQARHLWTREIWQPAWLRNRSARGRLYAVLRVLSITVTGLNENKVASRAAALSYSSLLGIGPLVAIAVMVSGFVLEGNPDLAVKTLNRAIHFIAPTVGEYEEVARPRATETETIGEETPQVVEMNPRTAELLDNFIRGSRSPTVGLMGILVLIVIVVQLFSVVEDTFNSIWGVRRGRSWMARVFSYWTVATLGAVLAFAALTLLSAAALIGTLERVPFVGGQLSAGAELFLSIAGPFLSFVLVGGLLALFYRYIPNTRVHWVPALVGAVIVVLLLNINNFLAFLYFRRAVLTESLYGSLGILPILMLGLFIFWFIILIGGQLTYALQNVNFRSSKVAWDDLNHDTREGLCLLVLTLICRRFKNCLPAYSASQLSDLTRIPTQVLNECLSRLQALGLVSQLPAPEAEASNDFRYQPARPLDRITLEGFKRSFDAFGESPTGDMLDALDPVVRHFHEELGTLTHQALSGETMEQLIDSCPTEPLKPIQPAGL
jgi:membrane protein